MVTKSILCYQIKLILPLLTLTHDDDNDVLSSLYAYFMVISGKTHTSSCLVPFVDIDEMVAKLSYKLSYKHTWL